MNNKFTTGTPLKYTHQGDHFTSFRRWTTNANQVTK